MSNARKKTSQLLNDLSSGVTSMDQANELFARCYNAIDHLVNELEKVEKKDRTETQSASRWVYLEQIATMLNEAGYDNMAVGVAIKAKGLATPNTKESLYDTAWRRIHEAMFPEVKRLNTVQIQEVYEAMNAFFAQTFGVSAPWPDRFNQGGGNG